MVDVIEYVANWMRSKPATAPLWRILSHPEFEAEMKASKRGCFELMQYEWRPEDVVAIYADPFVIFAERNEARGADGLLLKPPRTYVLHYNEQFNETQLVNIDWRAARELARDRFGPVTQGLAEFRKESDGIHECGIGVS